MKGDWDTLHLAAQTGHLATVRMLLARGAAVGARSKEDGWTALHLAAEHGRGDIARFFIENGAAPDARPPASGPRGLVYAAARRGGGHVDAVRALLDGGAMIAMSDGNGCSALDYTVSHGHADVVHPLLQSFRIHLWMA
jgi:ankyrin repeat protein